MAVLSQCVVAFDERRASPASNVGTLGSAGDVTWTGTKRLVADTTAYVYVPGVAGNYMSVPDAAALDITGDIELVGRVQPTGTWAFSTAQRTVVAKYVGAGTSSYMLRVGCFSSVNGSMILTWSADGTAGLAAESTVGLQSVIGSGVGAWVKATMDVNDGSGNRVIKFWWAADQETEPTSWTQLGSTITTAGTTSIFASTASVEVGSRNAGATDVYDGFIRRAIVRDGIGGTTVLDVDTSVLTDDGATSFTATTGQTVTINYSTGATYKTAVVVPGRPSRILNGTSDYGEVADNASLDFGASDSFTVWALIRTWATFGTNDSIVAKKADTTDTTAGWSIGNGPSTAAQVRAEIGDGTNGVGCTTSASRTSGDLTMVSLVRSVAADTIAAGIDGTLATPVTDTTTGSLANSEAVRFGRLSGAGTEYTPMRVYAWGIYPGVMTATQLATLKTELTGADTSVGPRVATLSVPTREVALSVDSREVALSVPTRTLELTV